MDEHLSYRLDLPANFYAYITISRTSPETILFHSTLADKVKLQYLYE
jgi:hypothetical protein